MVNKVILIGHVGKDPEVRHMDNNLVVARFTLATSERWSKDGVRTDHTEWHNIVMWRGLAEVAEKYVRKGTLIYVEGRLRSRSYDDKDGNKRYVTEILADAMNFVGSKSSEGMQPERQQSAEQPITQITTAGIAELDAEPESDLPF